MQSQSAAGQLTDHSDPHLHRYIKRVDFVVVKVIRDMAVDATASGYALTARKIDSGCGFDATIPPSSGFSRYTTVLDALFTKYRWVYHSCRRVDKRTDLLRQSNEDGS